MILSKSSIAISLCVGIALGLPLYGAEQTVAPPRIAVLWPGLVERWIEVFHQGLRANGYVDGTTAIVDVRATGGDYQAAPEMAAELLAKKPDVIFAVPGVLARSVLDVEKREGRKIPMVLLTPDPVGEGFVASAARPRGEITGLAGGAVSGEFMARHMQLLKDIIPRLKHVVCLVDAREKEVSFNSKRAIEAAGSEIGVRVTAIEVRGTDELTQALTELARKRVDAMIVPPSPLLLASRSQLIRFAATHRLPASYWEEVFASEGGLITYGPSIADRYQYAAVLVSRILHGTSPRDIPVDYNVKFRLVVNLKSAKALHLRIPQSVLVQADEVIE